MIEGGCTCRAVRYCLEDTPMVVHCCHCSWCQRETGSAFVVNALIESNRLTVTAGTPSYVLTASASGRGQEIVRCPTCHLPRGAVEPSSQLGPSDLLRAGWHHGHAPRVSTARAYLHLHQTGLGGAAGRCACLCGVLPLNRGHLARSWANTHESPTRRKITPAPGKHSPRRMGATHHHCERAMRCADLLTCKPG